jgi:hypothetical protein
MAKNVMTEAIDRKGNTLGEQNCCKATGIGGYRSGKIWMVPCQVWLSGDSVDISELLWLLDRISLTDAYDIFSINMGMIPKRKAPTKSIVSALLGYVYYRTYANQGILPSGLDEGLKVGTSAGAVISA